MTSVCHQNSGNPHTMRMMKRRMQSNGRYTLCSNASSQNIKALFQYPNKQNIHYSHLLTKTTESDLILSKLFPQVHCKQNQ